jgi:hypothetical protein
LHTFQDEMAALSEMHPNNLDDDTNMVNELRDMCDINDSQMEYNEKRVFPCCYTWMSMYIEYVQEADLEYSHVQDSTTTCTYNHFRTTFQARYPTIGFLSKDSNVFKCTQCSALRTKLTGATKAGDKILIQAHIKRHTHEFRRARNTYATTIQRCVLNFKYFKELSIVIDGMDQNKCLFPRLRNRFDLGQEQQIKFHLIGALVHGLGFKGHLFNGKKWTRCSSDTNITVLVRTIHWAMKATGQTRLPRMLYLQLDNCVKENKCNEFYSFLWYLVDIGASDEIIVSYCLVGHTHIDIDQAFSRISSRLRAGHITLSEFVAAMQDAYTYLGKKAEVERVEHVAHWGHAVKDHLVDAINGIQQPLQFRIHRVESEDFDSKTGKKKMKTVISFKSHCEKATWKGELKLVDENIPRPWAEEGSPVLTVVDVAGIKDAPGHEIMTRFETHIAQHVNPDKVEDARREWQSFADSEDLWAADLCPICSTLRGEVRYVSDTQKRRKLRQGDSNTSRRRGKKNTIHKKRKLLHT